MQKYDPGDSILPEAAVFSVYGFFCPSDSILLDHSNPFIKSIHDIMEEFCALQELFTKWLVLIENMDETEHKLIPMYHMKMHHAVTNHKYFFFQKTKKHYILKFFFLSLF